jgi:hypothetical protein
MRQTQRRVEIYQVTSRKDGAVYTTTPCGELWIPAGDDNWVKTHLGPDYQEVAVTDMLPMMRTVVIEEKLPIVTSEKIPEGHYRCQFCGIDSPMEMWGGYGRTRCPKCFREYSWIHAQDSEDD